MHPQQPRTAAITRFYIESEEAPEACPPDGFDNAGEAFKQCRALAKEWIMGQRAKGRADVRVTTCAQDAWVEIELDTGEAARFTVVSRTAIEEMDWDHRDR